MRVSSSAPPDLAPRAAAPPWRAAGVLAAAYLAAHLPFLAPSLEDIDSINFALGLRDFDPSQHQPHPPGSPVYIALGRVLLALVSAIRPGAAGTTAEALALALASAITGAVAIVAAAAVFSEVGGRGEDQDRSIAVWAALLLAASPLFWISGLRPMSDLPGLAAALVAQALLLRGRTDRRRLTQGAVVSGIAAGLRVQTVLLTLPLLLVVLVQRRRAEPAWRPWRPVAAMAAALLVWAGPVVADSGLDGYLSALGSQAGEDFSWVAMLWIDPSPRRLAFALYETFVLPWSAMPLAVVIAIAALAGGIMTIAREPRRLLLPVVMFAPYLVFHLSFHETIFVRYALPVLPLVAWLAARGLAAAGRLTPLAAVAVVAGALAVAVPGGVAYGREAHPEFRAIEDVAQRAETDPPAALYSHYSVWRALQAEPPPGLRLVPPTRQYEWLGLVEYWKGGGTAPVWFLADPRRTDLALIDPRSRADVVRYRWQVAARPELSATRPTAVDWYRLAPPGWFAGTGWSLTPETGGLARATAAGPDHRPIEAWVRRRPGPLHLVIGGRHLGEPGDPAAEVELAVDGTVRDRWRVTVEERNFLRFLDLPDGIANGAGGYAVLTVSSRAAAATGRSAAVAVRQFDAQSARDMVYAFGEGWHEAEYDVATGRRWRWTSERSVLRVKGGAGRVRLTLRGESPRRYFDAAPTVRVTAAGRVIGQLQPDDDFEWSVTIPADEIANAGGAIAIETDRVYLPAEAEGTADARHLGLRLFECRLDETRD